MNNGYSRPGRRYERSIWTESLFLTLSFARKFDCLTFKIVPSKFISLIVALYENSCGPVQLYGKLSPKSITFSRTKSIDTKSGSVNLKINSIVTVFVRIGKALDSHVGLGYDFLAIRVLLSAQCASEYNAAGKLITELAFRLSDLWTTSYDDYPLGHTDSPFKGFTNSSDELLRKLFWLRVVQLCQVFLDSHCGEALKVCALAGFLWVCAKRLRHQERTVEALTMLALLLWKPGGHNDLAVRDYELMQLDERLFTDFTSVRRRKKGVSTNNSTKRRKSNSGGHELPPMGKRYGNMRSIQSIKRIVHSDPINPTKRSSMVDERIFSPHNYSQGEKLNTDLYPYSVLQKNDFAEVTHNIPNTDYTIIISCHCVTFFGSVKPRFLVLHFVEQEHLRKLPSLFEDKQKEKLIECNLSKSVASQGMGHLGSNALVTLLVRGKPPGFYMQEPQLLRGICRMHPPANKFSVNKILDRIRAEYFLTCVQFGVYLEHKLDNTLRNATTLLNPRRNQIRRICPHINTLLERLPLKGRVNASCRGYFTILRTLCPDKALHVNIRLSKLDGQFSNVCYG
ncbi:hypothetical protein CSKR_108905, partial [Clonorchis sinensis]